MKYKEAVAYASDYEYRQAQREERKQDRQRRDARRGRKQQWTPKGADE